MAYADDVDASGQYPGLRGGVAVDVQVNDTALLVKGQVARAALDAQMESEMRELKDLSEEIGKGDISFSFMIAGVVTLFTPRRSSTT